jgi:BCD family chlorophyll transporter-like MFS transporter
LYALIFFGLARGCYNVGISHLTMGLAHPAFSGVFMGLWNLISGLALAAGEMTGGLLRDQMLAITGTPQGAYGLVFLLEGLGLVACLALLKSLKREQYQLNLAVLLANHRC